MTVQHWKLNQPGKRCILSGNEAAARGALEAGIQLAASYPGSPSVQIIECLAAAAKENGIYVEWSINEKVALEVAAAGSFAGIRALAVMKADGLNVAMDFLTTLPLSGIRGGLVIVVSDDPGAHSSIKEEDSRYLAPPAHIPLIEPSGPEETKDIISWAFELSETSSLPVIVRLTTRICHARATVALGSIMPGRDTPEYLPDSSFITAARFHPIAHQRLDALKSIFADSHFNSYSGPPEPELVVFACGVSAVYALEAIERINLEDRVGLLKIATVWPLPDRFILENLKRSSGIIFFEEIEPFLEDQTKIMAAQYRDEIGPLKFMGKRSGEVPWVMKARGMGELDPDIVTRALADVLEIDFESGSKTARQQKEALEQIELPPRLPSLCAGCPHRASYWAIKTALQMDGRNGFVLGDIGCYTLGVMPTGFETLCSVHSMGSGIGIASGFGKLNELGLRQPVVAVIGDSTFYHAGIPALINAKNTNSNYLCIILDNHTTAMTGHQPHPGSGLTATGESTAGMPLPDLIRNLGIPLTLGDPYNIQETTETILDLMNKEKLHVLLLQRECALTASKTGIPDRVYVNPENCLGESCGCNMLCSRVFSCPANVWDSETGKARIDEVVCNACGVCAAICPQGAIVADTQRNSP
jgi:indolepyruvate ferredoxin oxidoreductase alpha subunit